MNYLSRQIVFREIPNEVSMSYLITGCTFRCPGCHSADSWNADGGKPLSLQILTTHLQKYKEWITCVLFMGGEWNETELIQFCQLVHEHKMKTALYTGAEKVSPQLLASLDYLKTGSYVRDLGGLDNRQSNQKLVNVITGEILNSYFINHENQNNQEVL